MNDLLNIIITTYDSGDGKRTEMLYQTLYALLNKLAYDNLHYVITDDSIPEVHYQQIARVEQMLIDYQWPYTFINTNRKGVGYGKNNALKQSFERSNLVLLMEDDWKLKDFLNIQSHMEVLRDNENVGMIRFGFLGGKMEAVHTDYGFPKTYWTLKHGSGHYVYSGQVSLRHRRWYDSLGYHVEGVQAGQEEDEYCHRYNNAKTPPDILWPCQYGSMLNCGPFINIGMDNSTNAVTP